MSGGGGGGGESIRFGCGRYWNHSPFQSRVYSKFKVGESEMRPCYADVMAAEHLLQHCQLHDALRRNMWPESIPLRAKLYGNLI